MFRYLDPVLRSVFTKNITTILLQYILVTYPVTSKLQFKINTHLCLFLAT